MKIVSKKWNLQIIYLKFTISLFQMMIIVVKDCYNLKKKLAVFYSKFMEVIQKNIKKKKIIYQFSKVLKKIQRTLQVKKQAE